MCGICGLVYPDPARPIPEERLRAMRDRLIHRGPDDAGMFLEPGVGLGSRRLSILDLSPRGHMPMSSSDGRYWIVHNGEVYNYRELRRPLEARGIPFQSNTDTEVLLQLAIAEGPAMLERLNGMFAFAVWDRRERTLFVARDRLGIKPLYYAEAEGGVLFASEEKALFAAGVPARLDPATWEELLGFRYVAGERTPYAGVRRLLPGHYLTWRDGRVETRRWWNLAERARARRESLPADPVAWYRETFDDAVALRRISDVPLGVLLSGGLDSGSVAAGLARQAGRGVASFTVRFERKDFDEGPLARQVAERWGLEPHELWVSVEELLGRLEEATRLNDAPLAHASDLHLLAISRHAKPRVTVLLSGEGGDETLGGYIRYRPLRHPRWLEVARPLIPAAAGLPRVGRRAAKLARFLGLGSVDRMVLFNSCDVLPGDLAALGLPGDGAGEYRDRVLSEARGLYPDEPFRQAMYSDLHTFLCSILDRNDRMTMGASIECRVPFLDYRLVEGLAALPTRSLLAGAGYKGLLRRALGDRLPDPVLKYRKWGFSVAWRRYLRDVPALRSLVSSLPDRDPLRDGPLDRAAVRRLVDSFLGEDPRGEELVRQLVMLALWAENCLKPPAREPAPAGAAPGPPTP